MAAAAKHLTPVALELGGKCPVIVDSNVDLHVAVKRIAVGKWGCNNGHACIARDYIVTTKSFVTELVDPLKRVLERFYGQDPLQSADLFRIVNSNHFQRLINLTEDKKLAKKIVLGGQTDEKQLKIAPTVLVDVPPDSALMTREIFGPFLRIVTVDKIEESIDFVNTRTKPLAAYLFTKSKKLQEDFVSSRSNARQRCRPACNPPLRTESISEPTHICSCHEHITFACNKMVICFDFSPNGAAHEPAFAVQGHRRQRDGVLPPQVQLRLLQPQEGCPNLRVRRRGDGKLEGVGIVFDPHLSELFDHIVIIKPNLYTIGASSLKLILALILAPWKKILIFNSLMQH